ncbi:MAG: hypothetical protein J0I47_10450 [Sphingomonas sp.]|uniref:hypothetical protein n=1 Tax=Sphingomonas sp. TaxID=28214 RepID=UPI001ACA93B2|nr:hypothetical protein [Sphingomonas sp.]MBN8808634.1 hypothetical protein [Sphingomonas sp.]
MPILPLLLIAQAAGAPAPTPAPAPADPMADLQPAAERAIVAAAKACVGSTVDPAGQDARVAGWQDVTPAKAGMTKADGRILVRDNVKLIYKTGLDGGCVVMAKPDAAFDATAFYGDVGKSLGVTVVTDPQNPVTNLPNGEVLIVQVVDKDGTRLAMIVVGNPKGNHSTQEGK